MKEIENILEKHGYKNLRILFYKRDGEGRIKELSFIEKPNKHNIRHNVKVEYINGDQIKLCVEEFT
jgi:hypothetical protein